jgi:hypothetical protein
LSWLWLTVIRDVAGRDLLVEPDRARAARCKETTMTRSQALGLLVLIAATVVLAPAEAGAAAAPHSGWLQSERDPFDETLARPTRLVVRPASDYRYAVVPAWWTTVPAATLLLRAPLHTVGARASSLLVEVYRELGEARLAFELAVRPDADGNLELRMPPRGLPAGRYTIAVYDASASDYRWPLVEYRVEVE